MSGDGGGTGAAGQGDGGQQQGASTTAGGKDGGTGSGTGTTGQPSTDTSGFDSSVWQAFADESGLTVDQVKKRLDHARTWEDRAKANKSAADELGSLRSAFDKMQKDLSERDKRDTDRAAKLAMADVRNRLADAGVKASDVKELLDEYEPKRLLKDGEPDDEAIGRLVKALAKAAGRPAPDVDQGQKDGSAPSDMNQLIRRMASRR